MAGSPTDKKDEDVVPSGEVDSSEGEAVSSGTVTTTDGGEVVFPEDGAVEMVVPDAFRGTVTMAPGIYEGSPAPPTLTSEPVRDALRDSEEFLTFILPT